MTRVSVLFAAAVLAASSAFAQANVASDALRGRVGVDDRLEAPSVAVQALDRLNGAAADLPIFVRLNVSWVTLERASAEGWTVLDERLSAYTRRNLAVLLAVGPPEGDVAATESWLPLVEALAEHLRGRVAGYQIEADTGVRDAREYAFQLKLASVRIRAIEAKTIIAQATVRPDDAAWLAAVYDEGTAPYVDLAPLAAPADAAAESTLAPLEKLIAERDPSASRLRVGVALDETPGRAGGRLLTTMFALMGEPGMAGATFAGSVDAMAPALAAAVNVKDLLTNELIAIDDHSVSLALEIDGANVTGTVPHRVFYNASIGGIYLVYWGVGAGADRVTVTLTNATGRSPMARDPIRRQVTAVQDFSLNDTTKVSRMIVHASETPVVIDFNYGAANAFTMRADVTAAGRLAVEEIVARHQRAQAAQSNAFKTYMASLRQEIHFRPSPTQVFDVVSDNRFFYGADGVEWEERGFSVNGTKWGPNHPGLPLLQAEKVLTLPLDLRLNADYRYALERTDTVGGRRCYVLSFEPTGTAASRYRGWVWIDAETFLRLKLQTIQTHLEGMIVSSEEITRYEPVQTRGETPLFLPTRLSTKQTLLIAGRNLLLEKEEWFSDFRVDAPDFEAERRAARASDHIMFRDTDAGVRYFVKKGDDRVVSDQARTSSRALAMGTTIDPTFQFPLPIFGINYLNFDVKGTGSQLALLFAGVFVAGNLQTPRVGRTPFDVSLDFYGIAVPGTDRRYDAGGERVDERVLNIPMSTGLNLGYQFTPFQKVSAGYSLRYDTYFRAPDTAEDFPIPSSTATHGATLAYEFSRHGYKVAATASAFARTSWKEWGRPGDYAPEAKSYRRYSIGGSKDVLFGPFQSIHAGVAWYGGARLDRFSQYQFGLFDEVRMHGVPSAGIRFPELVLMRGSYSFNVLDIYRLDLFVDHARGRDPHDRTAWRPVTGTGVALTFKTPWNTMFTADIGKSFIPDLYRGTGSVVLQVLFLKPL